MKVAFFKGTDFVSKTILFISRGGFTHAEIVLDDGTSIGSKAFKGVHLTENALDNSEIVATFDVKTTARQKDIIESFLRDQIGKKYDYLSIIGFVVYASGDGRKQYGKWFCSELVFAAFKKAGIRLLQRVEPWKVSPTILSYSPFFMERNRV